MLGIGNKEKYPGLLPEPLPFTDLFAGKYVAYQGFREGSIEHRIDVYLKRPGSTEISVIHDVPENALRHIPRVNNHSDPRGTWTLLAGPEGTPTLLQEIDRIAPEILQKMADLAKKAEAEASARKVEQKLLQQTDEEKTKRIADTVETVKKASQFNNFDFSRPPRSGGGVTG